MSNIINFNPKEDELVPMDEWNGECWKTLFDWFKENVPQTDPWDSLAAFIKLSLMKGDDNERN